MTEGKMFCVLCGSVEMTADTQPLLSVAATLALALNAAYQRQVWITNNTRRRWGINDQRVFEQMEKALALYRETIGEA